MIRTSLLNLLYKNSHQSIKNPTATITKTTKQNKKKDQKKPPHTKPKQQKKIPTQQKTKPKPNKKPYPQTLEICILSWCKTP